MQKLLRKFHCLAPALLLAGCGVSTAPAPERDKSATADPVPAPGEAAPNSERSKSAEAETPVSACLVQDGERIAEMGIHAIGTEPFWAADVKGRCVTYSHPENQAGTRVWTRFSGSAEAGSWTGALDGQKFVMVTRPEPGCSDGMSDKRYPIAVTLTVRGEERVGCAEPR
ncbi:MAG TPA: hypothetical protein VHN55_10595 [Sphingomicrobium sp.]|nr:hypothetical protein [Sphingomicrobium sp.]